MSRLSQWASTNKKLVAEHFIIGDNQVYLVQFDTDSEPYQNTNRDGHMFFNFYVIVDNVDYVWGLKQGSSLLNRVIKLLEQNVVIMQVQRNDKVIFVTSAQSVGVK